MKHSAIRRISFFLLLLLYQGSIFGFSREEIRDHVRQADSHKASLWVPDFPKDLDWFNSKPLSLSKDLSGKVVVLDFWTYCCINCIHTIPDLKALADKWKDSPVAVIGVHSAKFENERDSNNIRKSVLRYEIDYPVVNDKNMTMWEILHIDAWPSVAVLGPENNLLAIVSGEGNKENLDLLIEETLKYYGKEAFDNSPLPMDLLSLPDQSLKFPGKLAIVEDTLFISDSNHNQIVAADLNGKELYRIGSGKAGLTDGSFQTGSFFRLQGLAYQKPYLYVADTDNNAVRRVDLENKTISTLITDVRSPWDVTLESNTLYIAVAGSHQIWKHNIKEGSTNVYSGTRAELHKNAEDPLEAAWSQPSGLTIGNGELYIADSESSAIRAIDLKSGTSRTVAGADPKQPRNLFLYGDLDGVFDQARLQHPLGVLYVPQINKVLVADTYNHRIKILDPKTNRIERFVGSGEPGDRDGQGLDASFYEPSGFALDGNTVYIADTNNHKIRILDLETLRVTTLEISK